MSKSYTPFVPAGLRHYLPTMAREGRASVYLAILSRIDPETGECFPSLPTIAKDAGVSEPTAKRAKRWLVDAGLLVLVKTDGRSNRYRCRPLHADGRIEGGPDTSDPGNAVTRVADLPGSQSYPGQPIARVTNLPSTRARDLPDTRVTPLPAKEQQRREQQQGTTEVAADAAGASLIVAEEVVDTAPTATPEPGGSPAASEQGVTILLTATSAAPIDEVDWSEFDDGEDAEADGDDWECPPPDEDQPVQPAGNVPSPAPTTPAEPRRKVKRVRRTTEREELVRQSFENLICWLGYGIDAVGTPIDEWRTLEPADGNWFDDGQRCGDAGNLPRQECSDLQLSAWAWLELNLARRDAGEGIVLYEKSLLGKDGRPENVRKLLATEGKVETIRLVRCIAENYLRLRDAVHARWSSYRAALLDENLFNDAELIREAKTLLAAAPLTPSDMIWAA